MTVFVLGFNHDSVQLIRSELRSLWSLRSLRMRLLRLKAELRETRNGVDHVAREVNR